MDIPCLTLSAFRSSDVIFSRQIRAPNYPFAKYSQTPPPPSVIAFSDSKSCRKLSTNKSHCIKALPLQAHEQERDYVSEEATKHEVPIPNKTDVLLRFLRPFPLIITPILFSSVFARTLMENPHIFRWSNGFVLVKIIAAITSIGCANFYATGINQIFDIETDKINKPHLPLSSGEMPIEYAWLLVMGFVAISLLTAGTLNSLPFLAFIFCLLLVDSIYSIPPFRTKASTIGAPITQSMGGGFIQFWANFAGVGAVLGVPYRMSLPMTYMLIFCGIYALSMGILKDVADVKGDQESNIPTIATIIGARKTYLLCLGIFITNHLIGIILATIRPQIFRSYFMIPLHILSVFFMLYKAWKLDQINYEEKQSVSTYFSFWGVYLFHMIMFPFI